MSDYEFISSDAGTIVSTLIQRYESISGTPVQPASPERLFIEWVAALIVQERVNINYAANQNIPSRAVGSNLDALAEFFAVPARPAAKKAVCTILFTLTAAQENDVTFPVNTQISDAGGTVIFATDAALTIPAGDTSGTVTATCTVAGASGNGYAPGQISVPVGAQEAYFGTAANTDATAGGADEATDEEFFRLMKLSLATFSTAGAQAAYEYFARSVSEDIGSVVVARPARVVSSVLSVADVSGDKVIYIGGDTIREDSITVKSEDGTTTYAEGTDYTVVIGEGGVAGLVAIRIDGSSALASASSAQVSFTEDMGGHVAIYAVTDEGAPVGPAVKARILEACSARNVRPLTDYVTVEDPETASYTITLEYWSRENADESAAELSAKVTAAVEEYVTWQGSRLGRDINPSKLIQLVMAAGAKRVVVNSPAYTHISDGADGGVPKIAVLSGSPTITYGGPEDE